MKLVSFERIALRNCPATCSSKLSPTQANCLFSLPEVDKVEMAITITYSHKSCSYTAHCASIITYGLIAS